MYDHRFLTAYFSRQDAHNFMARKKLSINDSTINSFDFRHLKLKKTTIKTILKKKLSSQVSNKLLLEESFIAFGEALGDKLQEIKLKFELSFWLGLGQPKQNNLTHEMKRYRKTMISCKQLKKLYVQSSTRLPPNFTKYFGINRNLTDLSLTISFADFIKAPSIFKHLINLKRVVLILKNNKKDEKIDKNKSLISLKNFIKFLSSSKNLEIFVLDLDNPSFYGHDQGAMDLFSCFGNLSLVNFKLNMNISGQVIDLSKMEKFLAKVEYLKLQPFSLTNDSFPSDRSLTLFTAHGTELDPRGIVTKCSSLKGLFIEGRMIGSNIPQDLGFAKNITNLFIEFPELSDEVTSTYLSDICTALSQANFLERFTLYLSAFNEKTTEQFGYLHKLFSHSQIKQYKLRIVPSKLINACFENQLSILLNQLKYIQSLESLILELSQVDDLQPFRVLLENFTKLKSLEITIHKVNQIDSFFPFEDLVFMDSLEKLEVIFPTYNKEEVLKKLPKLKNLKEIKIGKIWLYSERHVKKDYVTMTEYLNYKPVSFL